MSGSAEQPRAHPRLELNAYVDYTSPSEVLLFHKVQNISLGGICIQSEAIEDIGTVVDLVLNFPDLGASLAVQGEGRVGEPRSRPSGHGVPLRRPGQRAARRLAQVFDPAAGQIGAGESGPGGPGGQRRVAGQRCS